MSGMAVDIIRDLYRREHHRALALAEELTEDEVAWRPTPLSHSIAFNL